MPGLGKEHVKMRAEKNVLVIKGEGDKDSEGDDDDKVPARYIYRIGLPSEAFKMDQIDADMKNGVLMVTVPKIKDEERKDVFEIKIE
jgi:HSP20 family protein